MMLCSLLLVLAIDSLATAYHVPPPCNHHSNWPSNRPHPAVSITTSRQTSVTIVSAPASYSPHLGETGDASQSSTSADAGNTAGTLDIGQYTTQTSASGHATAVNDYSVIIGHNRRSELNRILISRELQTMLICSNSIPTTKFSLVVRPRSLSRDLAISFYYQYFR